MLHLTEQEVFGFAKDVLADYPMHNKAVEYEGIRVEQPHADEIRIICTDDELVDDYCEDGLVFVASDGGDEMTIVSHGAWEDVLGSLAS